LSHFVNEDGPGESSKQTGQTLPQRLYLSIRERAINVCSPWSSNKASKVGGVVNVKGPALRPRLISQNRHYDVIFYRQCIAKSRGTYVFTGASVNALGYRALISVSI